MNTAVSLPIADNDKIIFLWEKYTLQPANKNSDFFESGGDSLAAINLIVEVQKLYNVEISLESFMRSPTIQFLYEKIKDNKIDG